MIKMFALKNIFNKCLSSFVRTETSWSITSGDQTKMPAEDQRTGGTENSCGFSESMLHTLRNIALIKVTQ